MRVETETVEISETDIAIVGMAAQFPGAASIDEFWSNLQSGISAIRKLSQETLIDAGEDPTRLHHKNYVPFAAPLDGFDQFDAEFFGFSPKEAAILDPQHRKFLEVAWQALENAGHPPEKFVANNAGPIGAFGGCGMGSYFYFNICSNPDIVDDVGMFLLRHTGNDKDFLTTRLSHVLDLKGPSINLQTACSTSLVAAHYACQSLLNGECDMALAGGVTIELPQGRGYVFEPGEILSPDGQCHAFDHRAEGTVFGSGAGVVVLRRLSDAVKDGDHIWGVIKGTAINNDGAAKAGYLAPSVDGQAGAIAEAQAIAEVSSDSIGYVECHGTGTFIGDPIEVAALTQAFRQTTDKTGFCSIGSVKTNIGHLDTAAGVASLIKTSLSLYHKQIPPSLGFEKPNPSIDFESSPFLVNHTLTDWKSDHQPRRAGVNSLGVGGTNAHAVLEEAPDLPASEPSDWPYQILTISGRTKAALEANASALAAHLRVHPEQPLADIAFTLKVGRREFEKRRVVVAASNDEAANLLEQKDPRRVFDHTPIVEPECVLMFPGGGAQFVGMARDLYEVEPVFQDWVDRGLDILQPKLDYDVKALWLAKVPEAAEATKRLQQPSAQLPLIMIVEYALAKLWVSWGVKPTALIGHSMGENTAACLSGVMSFEDCIGLVLLRGRLFDTMPKGGMLSVPLSLDELKPLMGDDLDIAGINAPELIVVSGPQSGLDRLKTKLAAKDIDCIRIGIDIAAHSRMLDSILDEFRDYLKSITLNAPEIPLVSNSSGIWITDSEAQDPNYWVRHLRGTVQFSDGLATLAQNPNRVYLEVGPGKALASLARMKSTITGQQVLSSLRHPDEKIADDIYFLETLGRLSLLGVQIDWQQIWGDARRHRVPLPTYAFQRSRYFIEPGKQQKAARIPHLVKIEDQNNWSYRQTWVPTYADCALNIRTELKIADKHTWLVLLDEARLGASIVQRLRDAGQAVVTARAGDRFDVTADGDYTIAPERGRESYDQLIQDIVAKGLVPDRLVSFWLAEENTKFRPGSSLLHRNLEQGFYSLMFLRKRLQMKTCRHHFT
jgi:acyl transferase domain-containing protein